MLRVSLCQRNKARHIMTWYARIFDTETKDIRYVSLNTTKKTEAHDLMLAKQANGEFVLRNESSITIGEAFEKYAHSLELKGSNSNSVDSAVDSLNSLKSIFNVPACDVTKKQILEAFESSNREVKASTYNTRKTYVKTAFRYIQNVLEIRDDNPAEVLKARKALKKERDFWTPEHIELILDEAPSPKYRLIWSFMAFAGLRIHEALNMRPEDIRDGYIYVIGKGQKPAKVPVSSRMLQELERADWEWDFSGTGRRSDVLVRASKRALGNTFSGKANNHRLRHSFASNLIRGGVGVKSVQKLLRHSNIQTTLNIYAHLLDEDLKNDIEKMFI